MSLHCFFESGIRFVSFPEKFNKYVFVMSSEEEALQGPVFHPPVYIQRYDAVKRLINELGSKRVSASFADVVFNPSCYTIVEHLYT